jgi:predicted XRE-type DNA-binding protein
VQSTLDSGLSLFGRLRPLFRLLERIKPFLCGLRSDTLRGYQQARKKFRKLLADGWELGSDNAFADLGLEDAAEMKARTYLRAMIIARVENLRLTQSDVSRRTELTQPKVSKLISDATAAGFSSDKLMKIATQLGLDVEIRVSDAQGENGKVTVAVQTRRA